MQKRHFPQTDDPMWKSRSQKLGGCKSQCEPFGTFLDPAGAELGGGF
jgi:hypothetical protein